VDVAIEQLNKGQWVHVFPEGNHNKKNQDSLVNLLTVKRPNRK